ncbi:ATP-binding protein [Anaerotalea alkaliphila]|uniref:DUF815 domain-containing protein n=1 Tax=Anaerotalea alkaliphila TaxID=2662126 RepID=A0A7X5KM11_9FIRM|nr:DUF815 domain-containing protein [Anaerotalea alkaliphila]NDL66243.1 DUF815 domain-containing protein [Anaerotalea alkaliphila]
MDGRKLLVYRNLNGHPVLGRYFRLWEAKEEEGESLHAFLHSLVMSGETLRDLLLKEMVRTENPFTMAVEGDRTVMPPAWKEVLQNDLGLLQAFLSEERFRALLEQKNQPPAFLELFRSCSTDAPRAALGAFFQRLPPEGPGEEACLDYARLLQTHGVGEFALYDAFVLDREGRMEPIEGFRPLAWERLYAYERQKKSLYENIRAFAEGRPCHHVLLVGASGTGKSSSVKAVVPLFRERKLKLLQMYKGQMHRLPEVFERLGDRPFKVILFIDDLSFEANEDEYKFLKSFIEGGVASEVSNILFCITSNRRHLIKEIRTERENDVHLQDFIQEMTSLSDRFGLTLFYEAPDQKTYFDMVVRMVENRGGAYVEQELLKKARVFALKHGGMSGRTAEQFVKSYLGGQMD